MSKICQITGKKAMVGNNVSHSKRRTKRKFNVNLFNKKFYWVEQGIWISLTISVHYRLHLHGNRHFAHPYALLAVAQDSGQGENEEIFVLRHVFPRARQTGRFLRKAHQLGAPPQVRDDLRHARALFRFDVPGKVRQDRLYAAERPELTERLRKNAVGTTGGRNQARGLADRLRHPYYGDTSETT